MDIVMRKIIWFLQNIFIPVVTVGTATMVAILNFSVSKVDQDLKQQIASVDLSIKEAKNEREKLNSEREFNFKIYDLVQQSIEQENEKKQEVAKQFVLVMVDGELRNRLLGVLEAGGTDTIKQETATLLRKEEQFNVQQTAIFSKPKSIKESFDWEDLDYDIFWCERSGEIAKNQAGLIANQLKSEGAKGRVRVRELPASVNSKSGYKVSGYTIRMGKSEIRQANALKKLSEQVLANQGYSTEFNLQPSRQKTRWYLSAYVCP